MSEHVRQSLSALMDDEGSEFELRKLLQQMDSDPDVAGAWTRYHAARAVLKGEYREQALDLSQRVHSALESEPAHSSSSVQDATQREAEQPNQRLAKVLPFKMHEAAGGFWRTLGSMAVAASVTAVVILGAQHGGSAQEPSAPAVVAANDEVVLPAPKHSSNVQRAQFGQLQLNEPSVVEPDIIRLPQGLEHYIRQHHSMNQQQVAQWNASWVPEGFSPVRRELKSGAEVMLFSDGVRHFSVCVEPFGERKSAEGVAQVAGLVALGKRVDKQFVTVVGDVPLMVADRIASSVNQLPAPAGGSQ